MKAEIATALAELQATFPGVVITALENGNGSVYVTVGEVFFGDQWKPAYSPISFTIGYQYPYEDCYPHFVPVLAKKDGSALGEAIHENQKTPQGKKAVMISRRNNHVTEVPDTATTKLLKVLDWMRSR